ncbi:DNA-binding transcriptional regulator, AcrR family [Saccharopolyspora antimicrobica]|uniref:DNA-binding transcriptional regulator, AcrR family n=1 Tax=Saccharopolyspora antimicrobica TaxID=455193 RepID=A0A1I4ST14_9PSEU|nr:TetR/AcrR family transcriptional regulator [Saccharopolyspora antimicrobica]RKT86016.1 TetR family transcriptional regulator [Saccharopolyspora antimicrobica]SFM67545.1 DNA-binding transcriptional regulator, AcrR family [Saccharopolyspora antimicrobica]
MPAVPGTERADARRNREVVLRAAMRAFTEGGLEVSLGQVARRAGVGAGTVYRHFPSKDVLVEAVLAEHVAELVAAAEQWADRAAPGDALFGFLLDAIGKSAERQHFCDAFTADRSWPRAVFTAATQRFSEALDRLLRNAKQAGAVREEVRADDLAAIIIGGAALRSAHPNRARSTRLVRLMLDGLRTVTEDGRFRDTSAGQRHGTEECCVECGARLRSRSTGRPARYCGATCRQRARRRRASG